MTAFVPRRGCPACASEESRTLYRCAFQDEPLLGFLRTYYNSECAAALPPGTYQVEKCDRCATLFQAEVGDEQLLSLIYGEWLDHVRDPEAELPAYAFDVANPRLSRDGHEIMTAAAFLRRPLGSLTTLDFGMGWGGWARVAHQLGCRSFGCELSENRIAYARRHGVTTVSLREAETLNADLINMEQVLEHLTDPRAVVASLARALAPGGVLKIGVPQPTGAEEALANNRIRYPDIMPIQPLEHVNCFNAGALADLGREHGLRPVRPHLAARFAYLAHGGVDPRFPRNTLKEAIRPFYTFRSKRMLTMWLQKPI